MSTRKFREFMPAATCKTGAIARPSPPPEPAAWLLWKSRNFWKRKDINSVSSFQAKAKTFRRGWTRINADSNEAVALLTCLSLIRLLSSRPKPRFAAEWRDLGFLRLLQPCLGRHRLKAKG